MMLLHENAIDSSLNAFSAAGSFVKANLEPLNELRTVNNRDLLTVGTTIFLCMEDGSDTSACMVSDVCMPQPRYCFIYQAHN